MWLKRKAMRKEKWPSLAAKNLQNSVTVCPCAQITCQNVSKGTKKNSPNNALYWRTILGAGAIETQRSVAEVLSRAMATFSGAYAPPDVKFPRNAMPL